MAAQRRPPAAAAAALAAASMRALPRGRAKKERIAFAIIFRVASMRALPRGSAKFKPEMAVTSSSERFNEGAAAWQRKGRSSRAGANAG